VRVYPARRDASGLRFAVVASRFNHLVTAGLLESCIRELRARGAAEADVHVVWVPGAFEIPLAARRLAETGRYAALVALGAVIRGETPHFDYVCRAVTDGVRETMRDTGVPIAFGILTTEDVGQAEARADRGAEAARVAVEMARLLPELERPPEPQK
jgi:6,7-dimethyl-8-ribityllumazine synthase